MKGLPMYLQTRADWENAVEYAIQHRDVRAELISCLLSLKASKTMRVLKAGVEKPSEELSPDDFEEVSKIVLQARKIKDKILAETDLDIIQSLMEEFCK